MVETSHTAGLWPALYEPFRNMGAKVAEWFAPASDASADEGGYRITMELPGVPEDAIEVSVNGGVVSVKGEKRVERREEGETWFFSERQYGSFSRSFRLPEDADGAKLEAALKDGILTLSVPMRNPETTDAKTVKIRRG